MKGKCAFCHGELDTDEYGTWELVTGWREHRKRGGANSIRLPQTQFVYAHGDCMDIEVKGLTNQQELPL